MRPSSHGTTADPIPARAGVGLKPDHYESILATRPEIGWFEVHAENYMEPGGPSHHYLTRIRERYPLSVHGVGLSIGADAPLDLDHLARLKSVCDRYQPGLVSEHLAWSTHEGIYLNDLLPVPYTLRALHRVCAHIDQVQSTLGRTILLENPSTYVAFTDKEMSEIEFLSDVARLTGCGLLLDVNNVYVSAVNHGFDPRAYIDAFPFAFVRELHLGGHTADQDETGARLLIDSHGCEVGLTVWSLYRHAIKRGGTIPTLIEWDNDVPQWDELLDEALRAERIMASERYGRGHAA
ncbi:MAG: DUF692 domain-containing protein [Pseudomonadota bacterium]